MRGPNDDVKMMVGRAVNRAKGLHEWVNWVVIGRTTDLAESLFAVNDIDGSMGTAGGGARSRYGNLGKRGGCWKSPAPMRVRGVMFAEVPGAGPP